MKKLILAAAIIFSTIAFSACIKENVEPVATHKANTLADKGTLSQADFTTDPASPPPTGDKGTLSQADGDSGH
ncbi:MAG: hypothetical protein V4592_19395 [Bacteroidota bacterium]